MSDKKRPARRRKRPAVLPEIVSPCISICEMDADNRYCTGCYRTLQEIATWGRLDNEQRWEVVEQLRERRHAQHKEPD